MPIDPKTSPADKATSSAVPIHVDGAAQKANLIRAPKPVFMPGGKGAIAEEPVKFEAKIAKDGSVESLRVLSGSPLMIQPAMEAAKQWQYKPTLVNGEAVPVLTTIDVSREEADRSPASVPPPSDEDTLEASLKRLRTGKLAYSTPPNMRTGETVRITARIASDSVPAAQLMSGLPADQTSVVEPTKVSTKMKMTLSGADFNITKLSPEEQFVDNESATQWQWDVSPKKGGTLQLRLAAVVEIKELSKEFATVDREIAVRVDLAGQVSAFWLGNWQWCIATLAASGGAIWKWLQGRRKPA